MPRLSVAGFGTFEVPQDKRLVLAIEQDAKVDILHACGGNARCTTCRGEFQPRRADEDGGGREGGARSARTVRREAVMPDPVRSRHEPEGPKWGAVREPKNEKEEKGK